MRAKIHLILHNIRSLYNVGSIFRTADATGVSKIYLTGYTPGLKDIFGHPRKEISKTALGAEKYIPSEKMGDVSRLILRLKKEGIRIVALEQSSRAIDFKKFKPNPPAGGSLVLVLGNEVHGLSKTLLKKCDAVIQIPMHGRKESLNVSVAAGVALFSLVNK